MFKVQAQLTNVRPSKTEEPEVTTTPTKGNVKLNAPAASKMGVSAGDYVSVVSAQDDSGINYYMVKGNAGVKADKAKGIEGVDQFGAILASASGKNGGSLGFSSELAFRELGGNEKTREKQVWAVGEATEDAGKTYFKLTHSRTEQPIARKEGTKKAKASTTTSQG